MENYSNLYYYDGSFNGFLTVLFEMEYNGLDVGELKKNDKPQDALFPEPHYIQTQIRQARILWDQLRTAHYSALKTIYFGFMSEEKDIEILLLRFFGVWKKKRAEDRDVMYDPGFLHLFKLANDVEKEKTRTERNLMLHNDFSASGVSFIKPKYNILPLISKHLRTRYRQSEWVVFDLRRKYGLHHRDGRIAFIPFRPEHLKANNYRSGQLQAEIFPVEQQREGVRFTNAVA